MMMYWLKEGILSGFRISAQAGMLRWKLSKPIPLDFGRLRERSRSTRHWSPARCAWVRSWLIRSIALSLAPAMIEQGLGHLPPAYERRRQMLEWMGPLLSDECDELNELVATLLMERRNRA